MSAAEVLTVAESIVRSGFAALFLTIIVAAWQTGELRRSRAREERCAQNLTRVRVGIARLYGIVKNRLGESEALPSLEELLSERRHSGAG